ncbi:MAG: GGDEF domain-containing protein [Lachnospiraceae bacterium]|nr:GGDEF domain-containing protein [Lachnospiraceae bacterium]
MRMTDGRPIYQIGVLIGNVYTAHPAEILQGIFAASKDKPVNLTFFLGTQSNTFMDSITETFAAEEIDEHFNTAYDFSKFGDLDAMIISYGTASPLGDETNHRIFAHKFDEIPHIALEEEYENSTASIISDNYRGICNVMEHLITEHNRKKILHIRGPLSNEDANLRCKAYEDTMNAHHLPFDDSMILVGDYTQYMVDDVVDFLIMHPDADAVCCGNDEMALACYTACVRLGLLVGQDIAITGYDHTIISSCLEPTLSTVEQNGYEMGYKAFTKVYDVCRGYPVTSEALSAPFIPGGSCGCNAFEQNEIFPSLKKNTILSKRDAIIDFLTSNVVLYKENETVKEKTDAFMRLFFDLTVRGLYLPAEPEDSAIFWPKIRTAVRDFFMSETLYGISPDNLVSFLSEFLVQLGDQEDNPAKVLLFFKLQRKVQDFIRNITRYDYSLESMDRQHRSWIDPLFIKCMMACKYHEKAMYTEVLTGLRRQGINSAYIFLYEKPVPFRDFESWQITQPIRLAGYMNGDKTITYSPTSRPIVTRENGFSRFYETPGQRIAALSLFFQNIQYGFLMIELNPHKLHLGYTLSLQLSTGIRYLELSKKEHETQKVVKNTLRELQNRNEVLRYTSRMDPLTGLMNRSGFVESVIRFKNQFRGKKALFLLADLDHLKEINDTFGHTEGDNAICRLGNTLKTMLGENAIVARIGGDEFVASIFNASDRDIKRVRETIENALAQQNENSTKPYYVESSMGIFSFTVDDSMDLSALVKKADRPLYEEKEKRRYSAIRITTL